MASEQRRYVTTMSDLSQEVRLWTISFHVPTLSADVAEWMPELRKALPGSLDHFLLILLDNPSSYRRVQQNMAGALSDFLNTHLDPGPDEETDEDIDMDSDQDLDGDSLENIDGDSREEIEEIDVNSDSEIPATPDLPSPGNSESRAIDEATFFAELTVLREMLVPLVNKSNPVYWITNRVHQPQDMIEGFHWSRDLIDNYRWGLARNIWNRHGDCKTIQYPKPFGPTNNLVYSSRVYLQPLASRK